MSGVVEGVVEEVFDVHQCHPLGLCVSNAGRCGVNSGDHSSGGSGGSGSSGSSGGSNAAERLPNVCTFGPGAVLGAGLFLTYFDSMQLRARMEVTALCFDSQVKIVSLLA